MSGNELKILEISRLLKPKYQAELYTLVHLAYEAENSVRKSQGFYIMADKVSSQGTQECSLKK